MGPAIPVHAAGQRRPVRYRKLWRRWPRGRKRRRRRHDKLGCGGGGVKAQVTLWLAQSRTRGAFTLIELMMAVLVLALLTSAAALSVSRPIASARERDAMDQLASFDAASRQAAIAAGAPVRIVFDLSTAALLRRDGRDLSELRCRTMLPTGCRIEQVRIGSAEFSSGEVFVDVSPLGLTRSY